MTRIAGEAHIDAPKDQVWEVLADLGGALSPLTSIGKQRMKNFLGPIGFAICLTGILPACTTDSSPF